MFADLSALTMQRRNSADTILMSKAVVVIPGQVQVARQGRPNTWKRVGTHQLSNVLAELHIDTAVGKAQLLQAIRTPGMAFALG